MPRGKYVNHKGRNRHFTPTEELEQESESEEESSFEEGGEDESDDGVDFLTASTSAAITGATSKKPNQNTKKIASFSEEEEVEDSDDDYERGGNKGVASLIQIQNPNRRIKKPIQKVSRLSLDNVPKPKLSRREREELEKQRAKLRYDKLHAEGKTREAKADLARLAVVRKQRNEAAAKREAEKKARAKKRTGPGAGKQ